MQSSLWFGSICALSHFMRSLKNSSQNAFIDEICKLFVALQFVLLHIVSVKLLSIAISERKIESMPCEFGLDLFETCYHSLYNLSSPHLT